MLRLSTDLTEKVNGLGALWIRVTRYASKLDSEQISVASLAGACGRKYKFYPVWRGGAAADSRLPSSTPKASVPAAPTTAWTICRASAPIRHIHRTWVAPWEYSTINSQPTSLLYTNPLEEQSRAHLGSQSSSQRGLLEHKSIKPRIRIPRVVNLHDRFKLANWSLYRKESKTSSVLLFPTITIENKIFKMK